MFTRLLPMLLLVLPGSTPAPVIAETDACIWFVNAAASGAESGHSWDDAFTDLQDALAVAQSGDEIWMAEGRYTPDRGTGDRFAHFCLLDGVGVYGGFAGHEVSRDHRDVHLHVTILSGDLAGDDRMDDDGESCAEFTNCCRFHVDTDPGCDDPTCEAKVCAAIPQCCEPVDDGGISWGYNCLEAARDMCCHLGHWQVCENSIGLMDASDTGPTTILDGLTLYGTHASPLDGYGADADFSGALNGPNMNLTVRNCTFKTHTGACVSSQSNARPTFENCLFDSPSGVTSYFGFPGNPTFQNCTFDRHGLYLNDSSKIERCLFRRSPSNGVRVFGSNGTLSIVDSDFFENQSYGLWTSATAVTVRGCNFIGNASSGFRKDSGSALVTECIIVGNLGPGVLSSGSLTMKNCLVAQNHTPIGSASGISHDSGNLAITNCSVVGNVSPFVGHSGLRFSDAATVRNSVFWSNSGAGIVDEAAQISPRTGASLFISYSSVQGWTGTLGGLGNSGVDPLFVDPDGPDGVPGTQDDDFRLLPGSPAINAGDPTGAFLTSTDLDGHPRVLCGRVDLGPYESAIGDANCDGAVDLLDVSALPACLSGPTGHAVAPGCESFDYDANGAIDLHDIGSLLLEW